LASGLGLAASTFSKSSTGGATGTGLGTCCGAGAVGPDAPDTTEYFLRGAGGGASVAQTCKRMRYSVSALVYTQEEFSGSAPWTDHRCYEWKRNAFNTKYKSNAKTTIETSKVTLTRKH